ncbi:probable rRNA maturation factor [Bhargavaea ginsengi]|uniref:Endoribonuclease YbeY n=1 Tax=Bhargavaea ginsengi TaxID=426757 RepID=A0A1H6XBH6_9BACL|nr:rRNA maturation RNase YbeY [Bhargavaea ginsengi]MCM3089130.1 rRNA maturation RNase YbeY [Bhargavaea ginsengi]SEJ21885.1 probable rRNA maturation factor [Bhargavaea ginsengi]
MTLTIDLMDETGTVREKDQQLVVRLLEHAGKMEDVGEAELSVTFMDDESIRSVNRDYREKDRATDVISFALEETVEGEVAVNQPEGMPRLLGDILISTETADRQAEEYGHSREREIGFLALHGFLHLLGYDHMNEADERRMFGRQDEILESFGLGRDTDGRP